MANNDNPFIKSEDYWQQYNQKIKELRNHPDVVEFDKKAYYALELNNDGKELLQTLIDRYLTQKLTDVSQPNYRDAVIYFDGFCECIRLLRNSVKTHEQRIKASTNKKEGA